MHTDIKAIRKDLKADHTVKKLIKLKYEFDGRRTQLVSLSNTLKKRTQCSCGDLSSLCNYIF